MNNMLDERFRQALLILSFFLCSFCLYNWLFDKNGAKHKNRPPSPPKLPILGNYHQLGSHPHRFLQLLSNKYGDLLLIHLGQKPTLIVSSAKMAKEIMKTHDAIVSNRPKSRVFDKLLYDCRDVASAPYGDYWRQMKSIFVQQLLNTKRVRSFRVIREEETANLVEKIKQNLSTVVNLSDLFIRLSNDVVCRAAFGRKYCRKLNGGSGFVEVMKEFAELIGVFHVGDFMPWLSWVSKVNGLDKRLDRNAKKLDAILEDIVNEHLTRKENYNEDVNQTKDFVDVLLQVQREQTAGVPIGRDALKGVILDAFVAGTDTSYTVLEWTMAELLRHPNIMSKLQQEVRGVTKAKQSISEDDLDQMKYLKAVIKETLRLHPPVPLLMPRETMQELEISGYHIAPKTLVLINTLAIQRDPSIWEAPDEFHPERFLDSSVDFNGKDFELIPFGSGRRVCPGILFAMTSNELVVAKLVNEFDWSLPGDVDGESLDMSECGGLIIHRKNPVLAVASLSPETPN